MTSEKQTVVEPIVCECGCTLRNSTTHNKHLKTDKHNIMLENNGDYTAWARINGRIQAIKGLQYVLRNTFKNRKKYKEAKEYLEILLKEDVGNQ